MITERKMYYDIIRIFACFLVIVNHTIWMFNSYNQIPLATWGISAIIFFIAKMAVPIFVMLSGALLLGKNESYKDIFLKKIIRMIIVLVLWSLIYYTYYSKSILQIESVIRVTRGAIKEPASVHFWYIYMLIGLYLMTPFIRKMVQNFDNKDFLIFIGLCVIFSSLLPFLRIFKALAYSGFFETPIFSIYICYYVMGYYLDRINIDKKIIGISIIGFILGIILSVSVTFMFSKTSGSTSRILDNVSMLPILMMSTSFFVLMKKLIGRINMKLNVGTIKKVIVNLSSTTFGIYLVHMLIHSILSKTKLYGFIFDNMNSIIGLFIYDTLIFIICFIITKIMQKIPLVRNIV